MLSDWQGIYGSDAAAQKAAANEIRAMRAVIDARIPLRCVMSRLVHVGLHVVLATVLTPLSHATLTYGSDDAGHTICTRDVVAARMLADAFHLAPHMVCDGAGQAHELWIAADVEIHDNYVVDLARLLPATREWRCAACVAHVRVARCVAPSSCCL